MRREWQVGPTTYQCNDYDDRLVSGDILVQRDIASKPILRPDRRQPVHPRHCSRQHDGTEGPFPRGIGPCRSKDEENGKSGDGRNDGDDAGPGHMGHGIHTAVVCDPRLTEVMHPADGQACQRPTDHDSDLADDVVGADCQERGEKDEDGNEEGQGRGPGTVGNLHLEIAVREDDRSVSDEMHGPDRDGAHRDCGADQEIPVSERSTPFPAL